MFSSHKFTAWSYSMVDLGTRYCRYIIWILFSFIAEYDQPIVCRFYVCTNFIFHFLRFYQLYIPHSPSLRAVIFHQQRSQIDRILALMAFSCWCAVKHHTSQKTNKPENLCIKHIVWSNILAMNDELFATVLAHRYVWRTVIDLNCTSWYVLYVLRAGWQLT
jgi:hypothetical protein